METYIFSVCNISRHIWTVQKHRKFIVLSVFFSMLGMVYTALIKYTMFPARYSLRIHTDITILLRKENIILCALSTHIAWICINSENLIFSVGKFGQENNIFWQWTNWCGGILFEGCVILSVHTLCEIQAPHCLKIYITKLSVFFLCRPSFVFFASYLFVYLPKCKLFLFFHNTFT